MPRIGLVIDICRDADGFVASCKKFPGVSFRGATHDEALYAAADGFRQVMEADGLEVETAGIINPPRSSN